MIILFQAESFSKVQRFVRGFNRAAVHLDNQCKNNPCRKPVYVCVYMEKWTFGHHGWIIRGLFLDEKTVSNRHEQIAIDLFESA